MKLRKSHCHGLDTGIRDHDLADRSKWFPQTSQHAGRLILSNIASVVPIVFFYAISVFLFWYSAVLLLRRGLAFWPTRVMFATTLISFLLVTLYEIGYLAGYVMQIKGLLVDSAGRWNVEIFHKVNEEGRALTILRFWTPQLSLILGDCIVIWRAWVLYWNQRWVMLGPCTLLVGTIVTSLAFLGLECASNVAIITGRPPRMIVHLFIASLAFSLATNVVSTSLIMYKLWVQLSFNRQTQMGIRRKSMSPVLRVMLILVESGFAYCLLQMLVLITDLTPTKSASRRSAFNFFLTADQVITAMYPIVIVMVVNQERSIVETFGLITELKKQDTPDIEEVSVYRAAPGNLTFSVTLIPEQGGVLEASSGQDLKEWRRTKALAGKRLPEPGTRPAYSIRLARENAF